MLLFPEEKRSTKTKFISTITINAPYSVVIWRYGEFRVRANTFSDGLDHPIHPGPGLDKESTMVERTSPFSHTLNCLVRPLSLLLQFFSSRTWLAGCNNSLICLTTVDSRHGFVFVFAAIRDEGFTGEGKRKKCQWHNMESNERLSQNGHIACSTRDLAIHWL